MNRNVAHRVRQRRNRMTDGPAIRIMAEGALVSVLLGMLFVPILAIVALHIRRTIEARKLTQLQAAKLLGFDQP